MNILIFLILACAKYLIFALALSFVVFYFTQTPEQKKKLVWRSLIGLPLAYLLGRIASAFYFHPRPFVTGHFTPLLAHAADNGFPSDHTLLAATLAALTYATNKKWGIIFWILTILIGFSRIIAGVHSLVDILGSIVIALLAVWIAERWLNRPSKK